MKLTRLLIMTLFILCIGIGKSEAIVSVDLGKVVVTASRMAQKDYKIASDVTVIDEEDIAASTAQSISDVLEEQLGVHVYNTSTVKTSTVDIRGFGDAASRNVLVLVNDRKVNEIDISGPDLLQIPLQSIERIEIIRGAGSVLYGDNAVGGVINIITKEGKGDFSGKVGLSYGSYDANSQDMEVSGTCHKATYYLYSKYYDTSGYRSNSDILTKDFIARLGFKASEKFKVDVSGAWHEDDYGLPEGLTASAIASFGRAASTAEDDFASTKDRHVKLSLDIKPWPEDVDYGHFVIDLNYRKKDTYASFASFFDTKRSIDTKGVNAKYIFDRTVFNKEVNFVTGLDYYDAENDILGSKSNTDDLTISKEEKGVFGYLQYEFLDDLFVNAGTRFHRADYAFSQRNVTVDEKQKPDEWVSMGGLKYEYAKGSNIHLNIQETFRFLATDEWYSSFAGTLNTDLKQQTGMQYEIGVKHNFQDKVIVNVTPYLMDNKDEIFFDPTTFSNSNYDKTRRVGVEVGQETDVLKFLDAGFFDKLTFSSNYTYQDPEFRKGANDGKNIPWVPRHLVTNSLSSQFLNDYHVSFIGRYVGSQFAINDISNAFSPVKPYYVLDGKVSYKKDTFELYVAVNNIFDEEYATYVVGTTTKSFYPAPERNFTLGGGFKF